MVEAGVALFGAFGGLGVHAFEKRDVTAEEALRGRAAAHLHGILDQLK